MPRSIFPARRVAVAALIGLASVAAPMATAATPAGEGVPVLREVRIGNDGPFDRVVFEFTGEVAPEPTLSGPRANGPDAVTADPSGLPVAVAGTQVLTVSMFPAIATYAASDPPGPLYSGPTSFSPAQTPNVAQVVQTGDFESVLTWAIGYRSPATPRVMVLTDPVRVVVDIPHVAAAPARPVTGPPTFTG